MTCHPLDRCRTMCQRLGAPFGVASFYGNKRREPWLRFEPFGSLAPPRMGPLLPAALWLRRRSSRPGVFDGAFLRLDLRHTRPVFELEDLVAE